MRRRIFAKIFFILVILIIALSIAAYFLAKPVLLPIINKELQKAFKESSVSDFRLTKDFIEFQGIEIREYGSYDLKIKKARIYYNLQSILKKKIDKVEALDLNIDFNKNDIKIKANASLQLDIPAKTIDYIKLNVSSLSTSLFQIEGITLNAEQARGAGEFYIKAVNYNKLKIGDVIGKSELKGSVLNINPVLVSFIGGSVKGEFDISLDQDMNYNLRLNSQGLEIKRLVNDMEFNEKFDMTGKLDGEFSLSGNLRGIKDIKGYFNTDANGGVLIIKDKTFLENVARQSNQSLDIIVESFKNYNYNNGMIKLGMESGNLTMDMRLDGKAGKRSLTVVLHDFNKEERP